MSVFSWKQASQKASADTANLKTPAHSISHQEHPTLNLQRTIGNQAVRRRQAEDSEADVAASHPGFAYNFASIPVFHTPVRGIQRKLTVNAPGDAYEQEADRVSEQVMRMPAPQAAPTPQVSGRAAGVQRACACGGSCDNCKNNHDEKHVKVQMKTAGPVNAGGMEAPPIVHEVLHSPGQPLDKATREFMEPRFGHDFSHVRVHTDAKAAESARVVGARAYTVGRDLVFAEGQFAPSTWEGGELLGHELTHNLQQAPIRSSLLQRQQGAPHAAFYDRTIYDSKPLDPKTQKKDVINELEKKKKLKEITSYSVVGVKSGSVEEIFLLYGLFGWVYKLKWPTEANHVIEIGWPKKPGEAAPKGRVNFRIDAGGAATAELITAPALVVTTMQDVADKLKSDFGFSAVTGWSSDAELSTVLAALQILKGRSPQDIAAFKGVELIKVAKIDSPPGKKGKRCGEFFAEGETPKPGVARSTTLKIAQCAFDVSEHLFYPGKPGEGTLPGSFQIIFHEVGHAVAVQKIREARADMDQASSEVAAADQATIKHGPDYDAAKKEAKKKGTLKKFDKEQEKIYKGLEQNENQARQRKDSAREALKRELPQTQRLVKFVNLVNAKGIIPFTTNSAEDWPQKPDEFYAEAYSLWLAHPEFLKRNYLPIFDFFESGDYQK